MSSLSGFITYIEYLAGQDKGETTNGDLFNSPFKLGGVDVNYTGDRVVEKKEAGTNTKFGAAAWTPVVHGTMKVAGDDTAYDAIVTKADDTKVGVYVKDADGKFYTNATYTTEYQSNTADKVAYVYDNIVIPQNNLPTLKAEMKSIALVAKARRIAVYYSQIAAFQAQTDYGVDLGDQLAEKAVGQLQYEIDTEVTQLLIDNAATAAELTWSKTLPVGVSKAEHYEGFTEIIEIAKQKIYDATKRFAPNWMLIASNILPVLTFIKGWNPQSTGNVNGPYMAG